MKAEADERANAHYVHIARRTAYEQASLRLQSRQHSQGSGTLDKVNQG